MAAYTPITNFVFTGDTYTPATAFDLSDGSIALVGANWVQTNSLGTGGLTQSLLGGYVPGTDFVFSGGAYIPGTDFVFSYDGSIGLTGARLSQSNTLTTGPLAQNPVLTGSALSQANSLGTGAITQSHALSGADLTQGNNLSAGELDLSVYLAGADWVQINQISAGEISQIINLAAASLSQGNVLAAAKIIYFHRYVSAGFCSRRQEAKPLTGLTEFRRERAAFSLGRWCGLREAATALSVKTCMLREQTTAINLKACTTVEAASPRLFKVCAPAESLTKTSFQQCSLTNKATFLFNGISAPVNGLELIFTKTCQTVQDAAVTVHTFERRAYADGVDPYTPTHSFAFIPDAAYRPDAPFIWPYAPVPINLLESQQTGGIRLKTCIGWQAAKPVQVRKCSIVEKASQALSGTSVPRDPPRPPPVDPPGHVSYIIPTRQVYKMHHALKVTTLNLTDINFINVNLSYDADSFAWVFNGQLADKTQLPLLQQSGNQPPVQLIVTINGVSWKVIVEQVAHSRQFSQRNINIRGRGLTCLLSQPYEQPASATQSSELTVQQLAELLLPNGWVLHWADTMPQPWLVPSGVFTYTQQTPMQALMQIAQDIGAMLVPARDSQAMTIMPRYPVLPWNFSALTPDLVIPEAAIKSVTYRTFVPAQANGVYVHGGEIGGVLGWCRLTGSDGARLAPTVSNALMTDVVGCRMLGERILSGQAQQPAIQSLSLPFDGATFPLAQAGQLIQATADGVPVRGICNAVSISAGLGSVEQVIQIGEETPNQWAAFKELLPRDPLLVGTVATTDGSTSLVTLLDNGVVRVRGTESVGAKVYIRFGKIEGLAPNLSQNEIVI